MVIDVAAEYDPEALKRLEFWKVELAQNFASLIATKLKSFLVGGQEPQGYMSLYGTSLMRYRKGGYLEIFDWPNCSDQCHYKAMVIPPRSSYVSKVCNFTPSSY